MNDIKVLKQYIYIYHKIRKNAKTQCRPQD